MSLAALYREARFSTHPIGEEMRDRAREALQQVQVVDAPTYEGASEEE